MPYLLLAVCCSASIALIFKYTENKGMNRYAITSVNYIAACVVMAGFLAIKGLPLTHPLHLIESISDIGSALAGPGHKLSLNGSFLWAVFVGGIAGGVFFLSFICLQISIRRHGVGLAGAFAKLGILVPMLLSLLIWRERPQLLQWMGIGLAVFSIVLVNWPSRAQQGRTIRPILLMLFVLGGLAEFSNKVFQRYAILEHKSLFLFCVFFVALLFSLAVVLRRRIPLARREILMGSAVGVPNLFSSFFLILALNELPASVVFPIYGAGSIVIINLVGMTFFKERLKPRDLTAVLMTIVALVLINL
ncbi:MAG: DMT family transporter [Candidatus Eisenbacteria bacterium]|uniref:DMT family transporter n=1 Tax=Eiseniibacteriota bacterium TaxID=2212470 RepID=A0A948RUI5_UNCEI|nr:DMT family transporter [Candidatus Eisenbacteria bacterium]MBU1949132.1 DMT family transporter [Candidatus Eisenbacteria bacterium]MBU2690786.1 DMT family transporter [Candidatus Eisenbacteria bacterium]